MMRNPTWTFIYRVFKDEKTCLYGIRCFDRDGKELKSIDNIGEKSTVEAFCRMLNENEVYPSHFDEIYDDYFG